MQSTNERRQLILEFISDRRFVKMQMIADEFASSITLDMQSVLPPSPSPEDGIIENECSRLLYRFIREETSKKVAQRIELFFYDEKSIDQIAESEGVSSQTVSESIANAIKRIRKRFRKAGYNVADI